LRDLAQLFCCWMERKELREFHGRRYVSGASEAKVRSVCWCFLRVVRPMRLVGRPRH
jgi:hypothetical protein